jgi:ribosome-associated toxin RatA of RatAB toxin-antitoxin module
MYRTGMALSLAAACAAWQLPLHPVRAGSNTQSQLTADERQRLERGELVERRMVREQGRMRLIGGTSWQVIDAEPAAVWQALLDTSYYPRMLPQCSEARVISDSGRARTVFVRHGGGLVEASYYLDVRLDPSRQDMSFRVDESRPRGIRAAWGFYAVRSHSRGRTLLAYGVMADIGDGVARALLRGSVHEWMMKVPWMVKRFVEGRGRYLYGRRARTSTAAAVAQR